MERKMQHYNWSDEVKNIFNVIPGVEAPRRYFHQRNIHLSWMKTGYFTGVERNNGRIVKFEYYDLRYPTAVPMPSIVATSPDFRKDYPYPEFVH